MIQVEHPSGDFFMYADNWDELRVHEDDGVQERLFFYDGNNLLRELDDVGATEAETPNCSRQSIAGIHEPLRSASVSPLSDRSGRISRVPEICLSSTRGTSYSALECPNVLSGNVPEFARCPTHNWNSEYRPLNSRCATFSREFNRHRRQDLSPRTGGRVSVCLMITR